MGCGNARGATAERRTRTTITPARACSSSPTGWAAISPARWRARWRCRDSTSACRRGRLGSATTSWRRSTRPTSRSTTLTAERRPDRHGHHDHRDRGGRRPLDGEVLAVANVGDSRGYVLRHGRLRQVTVDHSFVQELVAEGAITAAEARHHPRRNIVTRARHRAVRPRRHVDDADHPRRPLPPVQ